MQNLAAARNLPWVLWPQTYTPIPHNLYCTCESHTRHQLSTCSYNIKHVFLRLLSGFLIPKSSTYVLGIVFLKCLPSLIPGSKGRRKKECLVSTIRACTLILGNMSQTSISVAITLWVSRFFLCERCIYHWPHSVWTIMREWWKHSALWSQESSTCLSIPAKYYYM